MVGEVGETLSSFHIWGPIYSDFSFLTWEMQTKHSCIYPRMEPGMLESAQTGQVWDSAHEKELPLLLLLSSRRRPALPYRFSYSLVAFCVPCGAC